MLFDDNDKTNVNIQTPMTWVADKDTHLVTVFCWFS